MNDITKNMHEVSSAVLHLIGVDTAERRVTQCEIMLDAVRQPLVRLEEYINDFVTEESVYEVEDKDAFELAVMSLLGLDALHIRDLRLVLRVGRVPSATIRCNFYEATPQAEVFAMKEVE